MKKSRVKVTGPKKQFGPTEPRRCPIDGQLFASPAQKDEHMRKAHGFKRERV